MKKTTFRLTKRKWNKKIGLAGLFQAQAEKKRKAEEKNAPSIIHAIEGNLKHLSIPTIKKWLMLSQIAEQKNVQVLFSTHSA